ncbi:hypothetical protein ACWCHM_26155 [Micromonospora sp. SCSIO 07396]
MTIIRVRLCEADREQYGGGEPLPEELTVDVEQLLDLPASELEALDRDLTMPIAVFVDAMESWTLNVSQLRRVAAWLAVRNAGRTVPYAEFEPRLLRAEFSREATSNPPAGPSEGSSGA